MEWQEMAPNHNRFLLPFVTGCYPCYPRRNPSSRGGCPPSTAVPVEVPVISSWSRSAGRSTRARATCQPMSGRSWRWGGGIIGRRKQRRKRESLADQAKLKLSFACRPTPQPSSPPNIPRCDSSRCPPCPPESTPCPSSGSGGSQSQKQESPPPVKEAGLKERPTGILTDR